MNEPAVTTLFDHDERLHHGCAELGKDDEGWWVIVCDCGENLGAFLDPPTAIDELLDHLVTRATRDV